MTDFSIERLYALFSTALNMVDKIQAQEGATLIIGLSLFGSSWRGNSRFESDLDYMAGFLAWDGSELFTIPDRREELQKQLQLRIAANSRWSVDYYRGFPWENIRPYQMFYILPKHNHDVEACLRERLDGGKNEVKSGVLRDGSESATSGESSQPDRTSAAKHAERASSQDEGSEPAPTDPSGVAPLAYSSMPDVDSIGLQPLVTAGVIAKRNVPSIRFTESGMLEMLRRDANLILRLRRDPEFLKFITGKEFRLSLDKGWKDDNPDEYRVVVEYWKTLMELFKGYAEFNVVIVPTRNGQNGLMKVTCREIGERYGGQSSSITLTGSRDIGPRLITLLNIAFIGSNIPDIEDAERIADYNILIELLNEEYFKLTGMKAYIDIGTYTPKTIKAKLRIIRVNLRPIRREDYRKTLEIRAAIEALRAV